MTKSSVKTDTQTLADAIRVVPCDWGGREHWAHGERAFFEYHCNQSHDSEDAQLWYRSHQEVTVLGRGDDDGHAATHAERAENGTPRIYSVRFDDGHEGEVFEDELLRSSEYRDATGFFAPPRVQSLIPQEDSPCSSVLNVSNTTKARTTHEYL